jgi:hypothetical protein
MSFVRDNSVVTVLALGQPAAGRPRSAGRPGSSTHRLAIQRHIAAERFGQILTAAAEAVVLGRAQDGARCEGDTMTAMIATRSRRVCELAVPPHAQDDDLGIEMALPNAGRRNPSNGINADAGACHNGQFRAGGEQVTIDARLRPHD